MPISTVSVKVTVWEAAFIDCTFTFLSDQPYLLKYQQISQWSESQHAQTAKYGLFSGITSKLK